MDAGSQRDFGDETDSSVVDRPSSVEVKATLSRGWGGGESNAGAGPSAPGVARDDNKGWTLPPDLSPVSVVDGKVQKGVAILLAMEVIQLLAGAVECIEPFGQLLRPGRNEVSEIELRCVALVRPDWDVNDNPRGPEINWELRRVRELLKAGVFEHRLRAGFEAVNATYQRLRYRGASLEIFCVDREHWDSSVVDRHPTKDEFPFPEHLS